MPSSRRFDLISYNPSNDNVRRSIAVEVTRVPHSSSSFSSSSSSNNSRPSSPDPASLHSAASSEAGSDEQEDQKEWHVVRVRRVHHVPGKGLMHHNGWRRKKVSQWW